MDRTETLQTVLQRTRNIVLQRQRACISQASEKGRDRGRSGREMVDTYLHDRAYREWLKIVKIVYQVNKSITKMMSDELWIEFLKSDDAKLLTQLKKDVIDTSLNELWGELK